MSTRTGSIRLPRPKRRAWIWISVGVVLLMLGYATTYGPVQVAQSKAQVCDGAQSLEVVDGITVTPPADWLAVPLVHDLFASPMPSLLHSWAVYFDTHTGIVLRSPDQIIAVEMGLLHEWVTFEMASRGAGLEGCHHVEVVSEGVS